MSFSINLLRRSSKCTISLRDNRNIEKIGHLTYTDLSNKIRIDNLNIKESYRGKGFSWHLMDKFNYMNRNPSKPVVLYAYQEESKGNKLVEFYEKMGFRTVPRPEVHLRYCDTDDQIEIIKMEKESVAR